MKILFDHTIFIHQKIGGISKYIVKLNENLNKKKNISKIFCPISINFNLKNTYTEKYNLFNISKIPLFSKKLIFFINNFLTLIYFYIYRPNFIHLSYYNNFYNFFKIPYVLTVYDLTHEKTKRLTQNLDKKKVIFNAKKIFCISNNTKKDLINHYNIDSSKIVVSHLGMDQKIYFKIKKKKYLLFVGSRSSYKNLNNLLVAFSKSIYLKKNYKLIIFGDRNFTAEETFLLNKLKIYEKVIFRTGDDDDLKKYYTNASLFVFPSKYEGFGLPLLEAMRFGCPVVCSNIAVFKEVAGNSCFYFNPNNVINIKTTLERALKSHSLRKKKIKQGFQQIKKFTWKKTAVNTYKEYKKII
tara:strand:- start:2021 stop:3082 length:1062 start_codon:yes stop_codon:yes gene_type:complete